LMWYYRPEDYKSYNRQSKDINDIRLKYGSEKVAVKKYKMIA